jgi:hypothetical protein
LYLTDCEGRFDKDLYIYSNNWAYDMKEALNTSLKEGNLSLVPPIFIDVSSDPKNNTPWQRIPTPPGWEPGMPLVPPANSTTERRVDAEEEIEETIVDDAEKDVSKDEEAWAKFGDDLEKFNWTKVAANPKNPGPFQFKHLFRSNLQTCSYRPEALEDASRAEVEYVPNLKVALSLYIVAAFLVILCGVFISAYATVVTFHFCCCGKKEPVDYHGV